MSLEDLREKLARTQEANRFRVTRARAQPGMSTTLTNLTTSHPALATPHRQSGPHTSAAATGTPVLLFCGNSYLGLETHPDVIAAAVEATKTWGTGSTGSRLISGSTRLHDALEAALASHKGTDSAVVAGTGYQTALAAVTTLAGPGDVILSDERNHASLIDACRLSRATVHIYRHNDVEHARSLLHEARHNRATADASTHKSTDASSRPGLLILTDGVFSMDGDVAPLPELTELATQHDATLLVDDAHGTGILGPNGEGSVAHFGLPSNTPNLVHMGTLSKALASQGGFLAGPDPLRDAVANLARPFIFSTAPPPAAMAAASAALHLVRTQPGLRDRLRHNTRRLRAGLTQMGYSLPPVPDKDLTPIIPIVVGDEATAMGMMAQLEQHGLYVAAIRPPTVAPGACRLRLTASAAHTDADIDAALAAFDAVRPSGRRATEVAA